jgi:hypothetical protein
VAYCANPTNHPRIWPVNARDVYQWWLNRATAQVTATPGVANGNSLATINITGAQDPNTAVELFVPGSGIAFPLQIWTNAAPADTSVYRASGHVIKVLVGTTVTNVQIQYVVGPAAQDDFYTTNQDYDLIVSAPGVLANDFSGDWPGLIATNAGAPQHGTVTLNANGGFTYRPQSGFYGMDCFTYQATDGTNNFGSALVTIQVTQTGGLFNDDFTRCDSRLSPWQVCSGQWSNSGGVMQGSGSQPDNYSYCYLTNSWADCSIKAAVQFPAGAFGGGLGGRLNPNSGAHYAAWIYPEGSQGGSNVLKLVKFSSWLVCTQLAVTNLPGVGTTWHTLELSLHGNQVSVSYDSQPMIATTDTGLSNGGVSLDMWTSMTPYSMSVSNLIIAP